MLGSSVGAYSNDRRDVHAVDREAPLADGVGQELRNQVLVLVRDIRARGDDAPFKRLYVPLFVRWMAS